jgi:sterol desaturase/sphingolipid hydroxylase (fatty acid hydroxylase superfamily)
MDTLEHIFSVFADFVDPKKRVFFGYLGISLLLAIIWLFAIRKLPIRQALAKVFDRKVFFSDSSKADLKIFLINRVCTFFISPLLLTQVAIATSVYFFLHSLEFLQAGQLQVVDKSVVIVLFTIVMFVVDDFTKYLLHCWMHKIPALWAIHKVHHSATTMTPITVYRIHPLEGVLYATRNAIAQGSVISLFFYLFGEKVDLYTILGVNFLVFFFHVTGSNLRHSHISIRYWAWLERILISPAQHQLHHSIAVKHYDKNFGAALALWDWAFGSLHLSQAEGELKFGLTASEGSSDTNLMTLYLKPFVEITRFIMRPFRRTFRFVRGLVALKGKAKGVHR